MNILHIEEMVEVDRTLLAAPSAEKYKLHIPTAEEVARLATHAPHLLQPTSPAAHQQVEKMLTHTKNLRSVKQTDPNAVLKAFNCALLAIIYPQANGARPVPTNNLLLETLKCTLYSQDVSFSAIKGAVEVEDQQGKAMVARFFDVLGSEKQILGGNFSRYVQLFLEKNLLLNTILNLFYRIVLSKLAFEGAMDYSAGLNFEEAVINLVEYFDISYRNRAELFLFYEDNIFLALTNGEVILGQYLDNEIDPKEVSFKDSQGFNLIQSFLLRSSQKECRQRVEKEKDAAKIFNFSFESGEFRYLKGETQQSTPTFNESHEFVFGRKKKDEEALIKNQESKNEVSKMNLNASVDSFKDFNFKQCLAILQSLEQREKCLSKQLEKNQSLIKDVIGEGEDKKIFDTPIKQMDEKLEQSKVSVDRTRNIVNVKDKSLTLLTPQASSNAHECFSKIDDGLFLKQSHGHAQYSSSENVEQVRSEQHLVIQECKCRAYRLSRNSIASTVVSYSFAPAEKPRVRAPPFINNLNHSQKLTLCNSSRLHSPKVKRLKTLEEKPVEEAKEERKPTFLKYLKKNKDHMQKESQSSFQQSKQSEKSKKTVGSAFKEGQKEERFKRFSNIFNKPHNENKVKDLQFRDTIRRNDFQYLPKKKNLEQNTVLKKFDTNNMLYRPGLGANWHSATNFHQVAQNATPRRFPNGPTQTNEKSDRAKPYAPTVHLAAPPAYQPKGNSLKSDYSPQVSPQVSEKADLGDSHRILRTGSSIHVKKECK